MRKKYREEIARLDRVMEGFHFTQLRKLDDIKCGYSIDIPFIFALGEMGHKREYNVHLSNWVENIQERLKQVEVLLSTMGYEPKDAKTEPAKWVKKEPPETDHELHKKVQLEACNKAGICPNCLRPYKKGK